MTLTIMRDLVQRSDEWHQARRGIVTASVAGRIVTPSTIKPASNQESRALTAHLAAERVTGWTDPTYVSDDMWRGVEDEPRAIDAYERDRDVTVDLCGFMVRTDWGYPIGYSPDGLVGDDGLIEVKSRRAKEQIRTVIADAVPAENMAQLQCGLLVSGRAWIDYVSYCGGLPLYVKRVEPDPTWQAALIEAGAGLETAIEDMVAAYRTAVAGLTATERIADVEIF